MKKRILKIIHIEKGVALLELLIAVLIVSLSGLLISGGILVSTNSFANIANISDARVLLYEYQNRISNSYALGKYVCEYQGHAIYENRTFGCSGYCEAIDGEIVFIETKEDYFGNILPTDGVYRFIPRRNIYVNENQTFDTYIDVRHKVDDGKHVYDIEIKILKDENCLASSSACVYQKGEIINN